MSTFRATCNVSHSAREAGFSRQSAYEWRAADETFAKEWDEAEQEAIDLLEKTAWDRATGEDKSDRMLEILLKAHKPEKYVDKIRSELSGPNGGPIPIQAIERRIVDPNN